MKTTVMYIVIGLVIVGMARWWRNAIRRAEELVGLDDSVGFCGMGKVLPPNPWPPPPEIPDFRCTMFDPEELPSGDPIDIRDSFLVVDMWMVEDGDGNDVAYIEDEEKARDFKEIYYPEGRVEFITCLEATRS